MNPLNAIIGAMALLAGISAPAISQPLKIVCVGTRMGNGYPMRIINLGEVHYYIKEADGKIVIVSDGYGLFCQPGANCSVEHDGDEIRGRARNIPKQDPSYSQSVKVDLKNLTIRADGGGLDGGWSLSGTCKHEDLQFPELPL